MGLPGLTVSTGLVGPDSRRRSGRLRPLPRGSLPAAGEAIEAGGTPSAPIDPVELNDSRSREHDGRRSTISRPTSLAGEDVPLKRFEGQVLLIVNTASACGFTPQYEGLRRCISELVAARLCGARLSLQPVRRARSRATPAQIEQFCDSNYAVTFPMFAKIDVNGGNAHPLYQYLKKREVRACSARRSNGISPNSWSTARARWWRGMRRPRRRKH